MSLLTRLKLCVTGQAGRMARTLGAACLQDWRDICTADDIAACILTRFAAMQVLTNEFNEQLQPSDKCKVQGAYVVLHAGR